eukprot:CAMPEP_0117006958 /NCGR_PEP_ID=MMETSP0472-20121206/7002_1 /TAXON_ID=693140 ORGANISM="Tiarina fusus, Strain LIS" /NCGR_SAMPLE_ID=MMETSP0472 /ASSEMBLY_ACC=CAM_ASM_000603 /LENGTH=188 /DNA_ID=CAMNT_0004708575 /DNA_START=632 /DNA_END=1198 /DNA_ORIENTATION=+
MVIEFSFTGGKSGLILEHGVELRTSDNTLQAHVLNCYLYADSLKMKGVVVNWISKERKNYEETVANFPEIEILYVYHNQDFTDVKLITAKKSSPVPGLSDFKLKEILPKQDGQLTNSYSEGFWVRLNGGTEFMVYPRANNIDSLKKAVKEEMKNDLKNVSACHLVVTKEECGHTFEEAVLQNLAPRLD